MDSLTKILLNKCAELCEQVYVDQMDYIVDHSIPDHQILAIQGTKEKTDWFTNIKILFRNKSMHRGFKANAERVLVRAFANNESLVDGKRVVLTGHSLGGASATCLADILQERFDNIMLATFGSPRPGGRVLRKRLQSVKHYRFKHGDDVVPLTPPWLLGYVHTAPEIYLKDSDDTLFDGVADHNMGSYRQELEAFLADDD